MTPRMVVYELSVKTYTFAQYIKYTRGISFALSFSVLAIVFYRGFRDDSKFFAGIYYIQRMLLPCSSFGEEFKGECIVFDFLG